MATELQHFRATYTSFLTGIILLSIIGDTNTQPEMGGLHDDTVAMAIDSTNGNSRENNDTPPNNQETLTQNSRNSVKKGAAKLISPAGSSKNRRSVLPSNLENSTTPSPTATVLPTSTIFNSSETSNTTTIVPSPSNSTLAPSSSLPADPTTSTPSLTSSSSTTAPNSNNVGNESDGQEISPTATDDSLKSTIPLDWLNGTLFGNETFSEENGTLSMLGKTDMYVWVESEPFIISMTVGISLLLLCVALSIYFCYRRQQRPRIPSTSSKRLSNSCNGSKHSDAVTLSYINAQFDQKFLQDNPEEMQSLENDTFLNSLESMMFVNHWTDTKSNSKL